MRSIFWKRVKFRGRLYSNVQIGTDKTKPT